MHRILPFPQPLQKDNNPSKTANTLASPRKRGGGTADIIFWLAVQYSDSPAFMILKLFRAVTVGIVNALVPFMVALLSISIPYAPINPSKTALSHPLFVGERACVKSNMVYTLCKHMVYMLSITNEHKNELEMRAKPEWKVHFLCFASAKRGSFSIR